MSEWYIPYQTEDGDTDWLLLTATEDAVYQKLRSKNHIKKSVYNLVNGQSAFDEHVYGEGILNWLEIGTPVDFRFMENEKICIDIEFPFVIGWLGNDGSETSRLRVVLYYRNNMFGLVTLYPCY